MAVFGIQRTHAAAALFLICIVVLRRPLQPTTAANTQAKPPRFVFLIGLEGTGHHLYSDLVAKSPTFTKLLVSQYDMIQLQQSLYNNKNRVNSLWGAHCGETPGNITAIMNRVVSHIKVLDQHMDSTLTIPINGPKYPKTGFGMMSYPTYSSLDNEGSKRCALTKYPNIDLLYHACHSAQVTCGHIYLHRDPSQVLRSTTIKRRFHSLTEALHLYTTMLHVIHGQLLAYPSQLVSCWDYSEPPTFTDVGQLLGWQSQVEFDQIVQEVYRISNGESMDDFDDPYFHSMQRAHERNKKLCER